VADGFAWSCRFAVCSIVLVMKSSRDHMKGGNGNEYATDAGDGSGDRGVAAVA
jgi:hypothetical protein